MYSGLGKSLVLLFCLLSALFLASCGGIGSSPDASSSDAPTANQITVQNFGMHIHDPAGNWPAVPVGFARLWDSGVQWPQLEPSQGQWNFDRLDQQVASAESHSAAVIIVLALTPQWASARPSETCIYAPGNCAEPTNISDWQNYVTQVATRYKGRVHYYELWNEPSLPAYFTGSVQTMLQLSKAAYTTLKQIDPTITVLSPAAVVQKTGIAWLDQYLSIGGGDYADIIAHHFYQFPGPPEDLISYFSAVQTTLNTHGVQKPIWDTEMGWGPGQTFTSEQQMAAFVARTFLLHWGAGITHVAWYAWDDHNWASLRFTEADNVTPTSAGLAFQTMQQWGTGATSVTCSHDLALTYTCQLNIFDGSVRYAIWNPEQALSTPIPPNSKVSRAVRLNGDPAPITNGTIDVDTSPVLLTP